MITNYRSLSIAFIGLTLAAFLEGGKKNKQHYLTQTNIQKPQSILYTDHGEFVPEFQKKAAALLLSITTCESLRIVQDKFDDILDFIEANPNSKEVADPMLGELKQNMKTSAERAHEYSRCLHQQRSKILEDLKSKTIPDPIITEVEERIWAPGAVLFKHALQTDNYINKSLITANETA